MLRLCNLPLTNQANTGWGDSRRGPHGCVVQDQDRKVPALQRPLITENEPIRPEWMFAGHVG